MAEIKKYLDLATGLPQLVTEIKEADEAVLAAAKSHAESLGTNYDPAGSAATAKSEAIAEAEAKVNALADGQVKTNKEAIEKLNGDVTTEGSVAKAVKDVQDTLQANIDAVDDKADKNAEDIAAINNEETGILAKAKADATEKANAVQANVDALDERVGGLPEGTTATTIREYVDLKTAGIATDAALGELNSQVSGIQTAVQNIEKDYLVEADKTELDEKIADAQTAADNAQAHSEGVASDLAEEVTRATGVEESLRADVDAIKGDYLKKADKDELAADIKENYDAIAVLNGDETVEGSVDKKVADAINEFATQITEDGTINTFKEVLNYISTHGGEASEMMAAIDALEALVGEKSVATQIAEAITAENLDQYATDAELAEAIARIVVLEGAKHTHANATVLDGITADKVAAWDAAEGNANTYTDAEVAKDRERLDDIEAQLGTGDGSVTEQIATAKQEVIDTAAADATTKANTAETNSKAYADGLAKNYATADQGALAESALQKTDITTGTANGTIAVEGTDVTVKGLGSAAYADATAFDAAGVAQGLVDGLANGQVKTNKEDIEAINNAETGILKQAKDYTDSKVKDLADGQVATNKTDIANLTTKHTEDVETLQAAIDANTSKLNSFVAISADEVSALFA